MKHTYVDKQFGSGYLIKISATLISNSGNTGAAGY